MLYLHFYLKHPISNSFTKLYQIYSYLYNFVLINQCKTDDKIIMNKTYLFTGKMYLFSIIILSQDSCIKYIYNIHIKFGYLNLILILMFRVYSLKCHALYCESSAVIREIYVLYRECFAFICKSFSKVTHYISRKLRVDLRKSRVIFAKDTRLFANSFFDLRN